MFGTILHTGENPRAGAQGAAGNQEEERRAQAEESGRGTICGGEGGVYAGKKMGESWGEEWGGVEGVWRGVEGRRGGDG